MRFNKNYKRGIFLLFLLLLLTTSISFITFNQKNNKINQNSVFLSADEDNYEPNNSPSLATDIRFNEANWLSAINGNGTLRDDDWYLIDLDPGEERLKVDLIFNHAAGNIDIEVYDGAYSYITGNYSMDDNEFLELDLFPSGIYYLRIFDNLGVYAGNTYDFYWEDLMPRDDPFEENDDIGSSAWVDPNYYSSLRIVDYDEDWFRTYLNPGDTIDISIYFNHFDGDLELELYDPTYSYRVGANSSDNDENIYFTADMSGDWRIRVYRVSGVIDVHYDLDIWLSTGDDWMEENDDFDSPAWVGPSYYSGLKMVGYDEDWFGLYLTPGDTINVFIYFDNTQGDLELELYDPSHSLRTGSYSINNEESFSFPIDISGDWRIRVYRVSGSGDVHYDLDIKLDMGVPSDDDSFEENDGFYSSAWIDPNWYPDLRILGDDEDWFHLYLNTGDIIDVAIYFYHEEGDLQLELYDPSYTQRKGSYSSTENYDWSKEHIMYGADMAGDWRIRVYHEDGDSDVHYDMDIRIKDDWYEFNNYFHEAYFLTDDERTWLSDIGGLAVQNDEDWYLIDVTPGFEHLIVNLKFNQFLGNIYVDIYKWEDWNTSNWIANNYSMLGDDSIDIDVFIPRGHYLIQIHGDNIKMEYDLWWDDIRTDFRPDDDYEDNDDPLTAYDISSNPDTNLEDISGLALQYDNDWYKIKVDTGFEHLFVFVTYDYQEGPIGIEIYDGDLSKVTENFTNEDNELISYDLPSNGTYYIQIRGYHSGNTYCLRWETWEPYIKEMIPGYDVVIILGAIFGVAAVLTLKWKRSKKHL